MNITSFFSGVILSFGLLASLYGQSGYDVSYRQKKDDANIYPYVPVPYLVTKDSNRGLSKLFLSAYKKDVEDSNPLFGRFFDVKNLEDGSIEIVKDNFHSGQAAQYYTKKIYTMTGNCLNSYPENTTDELEVIALLEFVEKLVGKNETNVEKQNTLIANLQRQAKMVLGFVEANQGFCSEEVGDLPRIPKTDFPELANYVDSIFMWDYNLPDRYWTKIARNGLYDLVASERGFWNQLAKKELPQLYTETLNKVSLSKEYYASIQNKEFSDFYAFATDFRAYLKGNQKSLASLEAIGLGCLASVEDTFKPFKVSACIEKKRLMILEGYGENSILLVEKIND